MENIIMPELITPAIAEILASKPEILEQLLGKQLNEEDITGRDLDLNEDYMAKNFKFLFCNVSIEVGNPGNTDLEAFDREKKKEDISETAAENESMKIQVCKEDIRGAAEQLKGLERELTGKSKQILVLTGEVELLKESKLILETRMKESTRTLKMIINEVINRKLSYRYKMEIKSLKDSLEKEKGALEEKLQVLCMEIRKKESIEEKIRETSGQLFEKLLLG